MIRLATRNIFGERAAWMTLFICGYGACAGMALKTYIHPASVNYILGVVALLATFTVSKGDRHTLRFAWPALLFASIYLCVPAKTILCASVVMSVLFMVETFAGRINYLTTACLVLMSPIAEYATSLFTFPIRLFLTSLSGSVLKIVHPEVKVEGNLIVNGESEFSVDPACMGLHMLTASLLAGVILISICQKRYSRKLTVAGFVVCMFFVFGLNILSNLFRIIYLVNFRIGPDAIMHEITGAICFLTYVVLPTMYISRWCLKRFGKPVVYCKEAGTKKISNIHLLQNTVLLSLTVAVIVVGKGRSVNERIAIEPISIPGYTINELNDKITKLESTQSLIYIKPIAGFYSTDHQPMVCWAGSGYEFHKVREMFVGDVKVYAAVLRKGNDVLYTAWWYDNGNLSTISQLEWRWNSFRHNDRYALINVTGISPMALKREIKKMLALKPVVHLFGS